jgi:hypothetical protein
MRANCHYKSPEMAVRIVRCWSEMVASPRTKECPLLEDVTKQRSEDRD